MGKLAKLDPAFKAAWVEGLRSGRFTKGESKQLVSIVEFDVKGTPIKYEYSVLGVAAVQAGCSEGLLIGKTHLQNLHYRVCKIPKDLLGNHEENTLVGKLLHLYPAANFNELADWIEKEL